MGKDASRVAPRLLPYLSSPSWKLRVKAVQTLGVLGNHSIVSSLHALLLDRDWQVVAATIQAEVRLGDSTAIPALRRTQESHWYGAIRQLAASAIAAIEAGKPNAMDAVYQGNGFISDLVWNNPLPKPLVICPLSAGSSAPLQLAFAEGTLLGTDMGEFGGQLTWQFHDHKETTLIDRNVTGMIRVSDRTVWVMTGLAHMGFDTAVLYRVVIAKDGRANVSRLLNLPSAAYELRVDGHKFTSRSKAGTFDIASGDPLGMKVVIQELTCGAKRSVP